MPAGIVLQILLNMPFIVDLIKCIIAKNKIKKGNKNVKKLDYKTFIMCDIITIITTNLGFVCGFIVGI